MSDIAIRVENLSKKYKIGTAQRHDTIRDILAQTVTWPYRKFSNLISGNGANHGYFQAEILNPKSAIRNSQSDIIWALKDISFELKHGEVLGIIGRNGSGKSTLLKILSQITEPTSGRAEIYGRVGSLLEVGTGFDRELTGRENIYLNGAILGMTKREIDLKFDQIVDFSGVEKFIDTPIKRYSSGMYVRLAFAVAAHLEPEILIVDEVLAVGDAAFQKKCLGKMGDVAKEGRTVIFVSHNMGAMTHLCSRAVLLENGEAVTDGLPQQIVDRYMASQVQVCQAEYDLSHCSARKNGHLPIMQRLRLLNRLDQPTSRFYCGDEVIMYFDLDFARPTQAPQLGVGFDNIWGQRIFSVATYLSSTTLPSLDGQCMVRCRIPELPLVPGTYILSLSVGTLDQPLLDQIEHMVAIEVLPSDFFGNGRLASGRLGQTLVRSEWSMDSD